MYTPNPSVTQKRRAVKKPIDSRTRSKKNKFSSYEEGVQAHAPPPEGAMVVTQNPQRISFIQFKLDEGIALSEHDWFLLKQIEGDGALPWPQNFLAGGLPLQDWINNNIKTIGERGGDKEPNVRFHTEGTVLKNGPGGYKIETLRNWMNALSPDNLERETLRRYLARFDPILEEGAEQTSIAGVTERTVAKAVLTWDLLSPEQQLICTQLWNRCDWVKYGAGNQPKRVPRRGLTRIGTAEWRAFVVGFLELGLEKHSNLGSDQAFQLTLFELQGVSNAFETSWAKVPKDVRQYNEENSGRSTMFFGSKKVRDSHVTAGQSAKGTIKLADWCAKLSMTLLSANALQFAAGANGLAHVCGWIKQTATIWMAGSITLDQIADAVPERYRALRLMLRTTSLTFSVISGRAALQNVGNVQNLRGAAGLLFGVGKETLNTTHRALKLACDESPGSKSLQDALAEVEQLKTYVDKAEEVYVKAMSRSSVKPEEKGSGPEL